MKSFTQFDRESGRAVHSGQAANKTIRYLAENIDPALSYFYIGAPVAGTHWFDKDAPPTPEPIDPDEEHDPDFDRVVPKIDAGLVVAPGLDINVGDTVSISNIPVGSVLDVEGSQVSVDDGELTLTFDSVGQFVVIFNEVRYLPQTFYFQSSEAAP